MSTLAEHNTTLSYVWAIDQNLDLLHTECHLTAKFPTTESRRVRLFQLHSGQSQPQSAAPCPPGRTFQPLASLVALRRQAPFHTAVVRPRPFPHTCEETRRWSFTETWLYNGEGPTTRFKETK